MNYRKKRIYLNEDKSKYCIVKLFANLKDMRAAYKAAAPEDTDHDKVMGVSCHYEKVDSVTDELSGETGTVYLTVYHCGAGLLCHELTHAVLWAWKHTEFKEQYPIVIKDMQEEEELLSNQMFAVKQFYKWFWKVAEEVKEKATD